MPICDATNDPGPTGFPNPLDWFTQRTSDCYNSFHQTLFGRVTEFFSVTALTPADSQYQDNLEEWLGWGSLKAVLTKGSMDSEIGVISKVGNWIERWAGRLGPPTVMVATAADTGALATCAGAALKPPIP